MICEYCRSSFDEALTGCPHCGAPFSDDVISPDYSLCPQCGRKLLSLGSPACNRCGKRLPASYLKAREAVLHRITEINAHHAHGEDASPDADESDLVKHALNALLDADKQLRKV